MVRCARRPWRELGLALVLAQVVKHNSIAKAAADVAGLQREVCVCVD